MQSLWSSLYSTPAGRNKNYSFYSQRKTTLTQDFFSDNNGINNYVESAFSQNKNQIPFGNSSMAQVS
jgi:hypothetical protein